MMPRLKKRASPKGETPKPQASAFTFPAPIRGWWLANNLATPEPQTALTLDNWVCTTTGIRARGGKRRYATLDAPVTSLFSYKSGTQEILFAATAAKIFDITTVADPDVVPTAAVTGLTSGVHSTVQFGTAGGEFLVTANGTDAVRNFNGTTWTTPSITGVTPANLSQVWSFASRLWFVEKGTQKAWYLPVDSIAGAAVAFSLAGVFTKGGTLLFGAKWSLDAGDGLDDKCVFVSTEGEVAIYEGTNPSSAADWRKVGLYQMPKPRGRNAYIQAGGDLLIATDVGLIPVSAAIKTDIGALESIAVSRPVAPYWQQRASDLALTEWELIKVEAENYMVVSQPDSVTPSCLVVSLQTGAWSRFTGWDTQCMTYFAGGGYFGSADSRVYQMEIGGSDDGDLYTCAYLGQFEQMGTVGQQKTVLQARPAMVNSGDANIYLGFKTDYNATLSAAPSSGMDATSGAWDLALWDASTWDAASTSTVSARWIAIGATGYVVAPEMQITYGVTPRPSLALVSVDVQFAAGAMVA
jgi:hypothetical protein